MASITTRMTTNKPIPTRRTNGYTLAQTTRPRGLFGQVAAVLLHPGMFFRAMPDTASSRQWVAIAALILALIGWSAVRLAGLSAADSAGGAPADFGAPPGMEMMPPDGGVMMSPDGVPMDGGMPAPTGDAGGTGNTVSSTWTTALRAAGEVFLGWLILAVLLCEVSLFNGRAPNLGQNFQIAVWASLPLGLMAALRLIFLSAGGQPVEGAGVSALLSQWESYTTLSPFLQAALRSFTSQVTIFGVWSVALLYFGGRYALYGKRWAVLLVLLAWVAVLAVVPVLTGAVSAPTIEEAISGMDGGMMDTPPMMDGMSPEMIDPVTGRPNLPPEGEARETMGEAPAEFVEVTPEAGMMGEVEATVETGAMDVMPAATETMLDSADPTP